MMKPMQVPQNLWGEAVRHVIYILNRVPTKALKNTTPYEVLYGRKPTVKHLRVFGCKTHMKIPSINVAKLNDRSKQVMYVGNEPGSKAFRLYDPTKNRIYVSRDVRFEERTRFEWSNYKKTMNIGEGRE
ncbi:putative RNA-directed DNA polymerase [Helianthus annuus]|nr:putative RNA-directed DNA polymerase [Helianthus annuus]